MDLTHGSLFAGIGGFDLGFERAGFTTVWQVEIDEFCQRVLARHFPHAQRFADVRDFGTHNLQPVTVITGGFPCQPVSEAGKRRGTADDRWLWPEMLRVIRALQPAWVVAENVPGLLSQDGGVVFESVLLDLEGAGYDVQPLVIPAAGVGAIHRRYRVFIVAHANRSGSQAEKLPVRPRRQEQAAPIADRIGADAPNTEVSQVWVAGQPRLNSRMAGLAADTLPQRCERWPCLPQATGTHGWIPAQGACSWGPPQPVLRRVDDGLSRKLDDGRSVWKARIGALGNAIVPQIAEQIAWRLREVIETNASA